MKAPERRVFEVDRRLDLVLGRRGAGSCRRFFADITTGQSLDDAKAERCAANAAARAAQRGTVQFVEAGIKLTAGLNIGVVAVGTAALVLIELLSLLLRVLVLGVTCQLLRVRIVAMDFHGLRGQHFLDRKWPLLLSLLLRRLRLRLRRPVHRPLPHLTGSKIMTTSVARHDLIA